MHTLSEEVVVLTEMKGKLLHELEDLKMEQDNNTQALALEKEALVKKNRQLQNQQDLTKEDIVQLQNQLEDMRANNSLLCSEEKKWGKEKQKLALEKETLTQKCGRLQEELKTKDTVLWTEKEKWWKLIQEVTGEKESLAERNLQLQNKLDLTQEELRDVETLKKERQEIAGEMKAFSKNNSKLLKQLDLIKEKLGIKDSQLVTEQEKWKKQICKLAGEKEALKCQLELIKEGLETKDTDLGTAQAQCNR